MALTPGKQPSATSRPTAGHFTLFGAPPDTGAAPSPSSVNTLFAESAGAGDIKDFAFPQSSAQGPGFSPQASAQASDTFFQSSDTFPKASDTLSSPAADAFSPPLDTFRTPLGAPPHKRQNQGSGQQVPLTPTLTLPPPAPLAFTPFNSFNEEFTKDELGEHAAARASTAAPSPLAGAPSGGAAELRELLADQQRRLAALVPELEEGQRREEELVTKLQAVEQDSQAYEQRLAAMKEQFAARIGQIAEVLGQGGQ